MKIDIPLVRQIIAVGAASVLLAACAQTRLPAVPPGATAKASVFDIPHERFYLDRAGIAAFDQEALRAMARNRAYLARTGKKSPSTSSFLALSGGGDEGAFGAGLLVGWSAHGDRPQFNLVTGISSGALAAPFAFLGPEYDDTLRRIYTEVGPSDIFERRFIVAALGGDAVADSTPLANMIARYMTDDLVRRIAEEYEKGRLLLVATTNLDAAKPVIWNIGAIAQSRNAHARDLIRKILLASASIPGIFPPVLLNVDIGGQHFQEMHVDGGAIAQVFLYPPAVGVSSKVPRRHRVAYVIRNGRLSAPWQSVEPRTLTIANRALSTLIASNGIDDLDRIYRTTRRDGIAFKMAYIGNDFTVPYKGPFDTGYMNALFSYGYELGKRGYRWKTEPPGDAGKIDASKPAVPHLVAEERAIPHQ